MAGNNGYNTIELSWMILARMLNVWLLLLASFSFLCVQKELTQPILLLQQKQICCILLPLLACCTGGQLLVEKDVVSTFLTFHLLKLSCCTQIQVEGWLDSTAAAGADKANNKQIGKRSGHYRITGFLVILMFFCRRWEV